MTAGERAVAGLGLTAPTVRLLTGALALVAAIGAVVPWVGLLNVWRLSGDWEPFPEPEFQAHRALAMAEMLSYWPGAAWSGPSSLAIVAGFAALLGVARAEAAGGTRDRSVPVVLTVGVAAALGTASALCVGAIRLYAMVATPEELVGRFIAARPVLVDLQPLLTVAAEMVGWCVLLLVAVSVWRRPASDAERDPDAEVMAEVEDQEDQEDTPPAEAIIDGPRESPGSGRGHAAERNPGRADPSRLRSDGSSESGYDEFRFRR